MEQEVPARAFEEMTKTRRLSENSDRSESEAGRAGFFDHLRRIVALFNEKGSENPAWQVRL